MPFQHHGGTPHTKRQQRTKTDKDIAIFGHAAGTDRSGIDAEPFNNGRWDQAVTDHTAGRTPAPTTGGTLSISEDAARLRAIELPFGAIQQAQQMLDSALEQAMMILGSEAAGAQAVQGAIQQAKQEIDGGYSMVQEVENQLEQAANRHLGG